MSLEDVDKMTRDLLEMREKLLKSQARMIATEEEVRKEVETLQLALMEADKDEAKQLIDGKREGWALDIVSSDVDRYFPPSL